MNQEDYLNKLHREIIKIMDEIDKLCNKNGLQYYLTGGSLLGAIRHKGFIPWDDDLDIVMPRRDFDKFIDICENELPDGYNLAWFSTRKDYWVLYAKVYNAATSFVENIGDGETDIGIFVDVFPIDFTNGVNRFNEFRKRLVRYCTSVLFLKQEKRSGFVSLFLKMLPSRMIGRIGTMIMKGSGKEKKFYSNFASQYTLKQRTVPVEWLEEGDSLPFENSYYMVEKKYEEILVNIFGVDYMMIPPIEKRRCHLPKYVRFSDGEEAVFDNNGTNISIQESLDF